jgi:transcriptional regulator with XRE-family HTH domain
MTTNTPAAAGPAMSRQLLGTRLRQLREAHGLLLADATDRLGVAPSTLSRIETGRAPTRTGYLYVLLDLYQITDPDERRALADLARHGQRDNWWTATSDILPPGADRCIGLEDAATRIRTYATQAIPDLLQAPAYAAAAARATRPGINPAHSRQLADLTARRQQVLHRSGFALHAVMTRPPSCGLPATPPSWPASSATSPPSPPAPRSPSRSCPSPPPHLCSARRSRCSP